MKLHVQWGKGNHVPQWNSELKLLWKKANKVFHKAYKTKSQVVAKKHWLITPGEEAFGITLSQVNTAHNRYCCSSMGDEWVA